MSQLLLKETKVKVNDPWEGESKWMRLDFDGAVDLTNNMSKFDMWRKTHVKVV